MSNFLAIAAVTAALHRMLLSAVRADNADIDINISTVRPDGTGSGITSTGINIYLYQITPNAALRNSDLPMRGRDGSLVKRPRIALDLHYLLSFYGDERTLEPQRIMGSTLKALHASPVISRESIRNVIKDEAFNYVAASDLAEQTELVKFTPQALSLDELSKLWNVFFQTKYTLSTAYLGTVVLIDSDLPARAPLPVNERRLSVFSSAQPIITSVEPQIIELSPGASIVLKGKGLLSESTAAIIGGMESLPEESSTGDRLVVPLPVGVRSGVKTVQVILRQHPTDKDSRNVAEYVIKSNLLAFVLRPRIDPPIFSRTGDPADARITVEAHPLVGLDQRAVLILSGISPDTGGGYLLDPRPRTVESDPLVFSASHVLPGSYIARLRVNEVESALVFGPDGITPRVVVT